MGAETGTARRRWLSLVLLAAALTVLDGAATYVWLGRGHGEANPLLAALVVELGPGPAMLVRALVGLGLLAALWALRARSALALHGLLAANAALGAVALWHGWGLLASFA